MAYRLLGFRGRNQYTENGTMEESNTTMAQVREHGVMYEPVNRELN